MSIVKPSARAVVLSGTMIAYCVVKSSCDILLAHLQYFVMHASLSRTTHPIVTPHEWMYTYTNNIYDTRAIRAHKNERLS